MIALLLHLLLSLDSFATLVQSIDLWTIRGQLSSVSSSLVPLTQLSKNLQQSVTWWQLTNLDWHPEALWRYMVLGPPPENVLPNSSWKIPQELHQILERGCLSETKKAAVAQYQTEVGRAGTGRIKLTSWVLMYNCLSKECDIVAPVILAQSSGNSKISFGTLWQHLFSSNPRIPILLSSSTADIISSTQLTRSSLGSSKNLHLQIANELPQCNGSMALGQSPLNAAYKVPPGICYEFSAKLRAGLNQTHLLVMLENQPHQQEWPYKRRPLHECANAPILFKNLEDYRTCVFSHAENLYYCANFTLSSYSDTQCDRDSIGLANFLLAYSYLNHSNPTDKLTEIFEIINDTVAGSPCNTSGRSRAAIFSSKHIGFDLAHSVWEDSNGAKTEELELGRQNGSFCYYGLRTADKENEATYLRRCNITRNLNSAVERCDQAAVNAELLNVIFNDTVTAYADEHNTAFNMDRGPATDVFTAWAALVTAAVSVITATIPCTNLELEYLARYVYPKNHEKLKVLKFAAVALLNVGFGMVLYAPIFAMILNESNRSKPYSTWSLFTNDVIVNTYGTQMRSVFIVEGKSVYSSRILWLFVVVCGISFPLIVFLTVKRCYKVFYRRELLLRERSSLYDGDSVVPFSKAEAREINVKAIEMGLSEFVRLNEQLKALKV